MSVGWPDLDAPWRAATAARMEAYFDRLWPLRRSISGEGLRRTHDILSDLIPLRRHEVPSGTQVLDWCVPPEWVVRSARLEGPGGEKIVDLADHNLHLINYSAPFTGTLSKAELDKHLHSLPDLPDAIPYVTSYYERRWGFCLTHRQRSALSEGDYSIVIDTDFRDDGSITLSDCVLAGESDHEVLLSTYTCHPSMANNELSGPLAVAFLYSLLAALPERRLTYRFVFCPETIGSIAYLAENGEHLRRRLVAGLVVTCCGDRAPFTYKKSRRGTALGDRAARCALQRWPEARYLEFFPNGSDERQYCSPGFDLPVGVLMRSPPASYVEYHTSLDNKGAISFETLAETTEALFWYCWVLENNLVPLSRKPFGEPQLSKYGLMSGTGASRANSARMAPLKWLLNLADGTCDLIAIADRSGQPFEHLVAAAGDCIRAGLVSDAGKSLESIVQRTNIVDEIE
jgi:aminopeptidase-like protein